MIHVRFECDNSGFSYSLRTPAQIAFAYFRIDLEEITFLGDFKLSFGDARVRCECKTCEYWEEIWIPANLTSCANQTETFQATCSFCEFQVGDQSPWKNPEVDQYLHRYVESKSSSWARYIAAAVQAKLGEPFEPICAAIDARLRGYDFYTGSDSDDTSSDSD